MLNHWARKVEDVYGVKARLSALDGELDRNFRVEVSDGRGFVLKVMRPDCSTELVEMQCQAIEHLRQRMPDLPIAKVVKTVEGEPYSLVSDHNGVDRLVWAIEFADGHCYADHNPKSLQLIHALGVQIGKLNQALRDFDHPGLQREFPWHLMQADWVGSELDQIADPQRRTIVTQIHADYRKILPQVRQLPTIAIHNDLNDYNILVTASLEQPGAISALIDFGDMCAAPRICELAIAGAYLVLDHDNPAAVLEQLVAGYHSVTPLNVTEIDLLYPLLRMRLAVSLMMSTKTAKLRPDDPYVVISQAPAWRFLEQVEIRPTLIAQRLRVACGLPVIDSAPAVMAFLQAQRGQFASVLQGDMQQAKMVPMSVAASSFPQNPLSLTATEAATMNTESTAQGLQLGYYREPRLIYSGDQFTKGDWQAGDRRTVHLGVDVFAVAGSKVTSPLAASVYSVANQQERLDYGGMVVLQHQTSQGDAFYTLYGHLNPEVCDRLKPGQTLSAGELVGELGDRNSNGGWAPHLHFQLAVSVGGLGANWPGVADPDEIGFWCELFPNPAALLNLDDDTIEYSNVDQDEVWSARKRDFATNLKLSYRQPAMFLRGYQHYLFDQWGRTYLDAYNNVPHVGHANPRVQAVVAEQLQRMNSNTRYLHPAQSAFAEKIKSKLPDSLSVCYFVNSGSEANELALRLARAHSGGKDIITPNHGYHGNTTGAIDISAYKFNAKGGVGQPDWVQLVDAPDVYRGRFRRDNPKAADLYAEQVGEAIQNIDARGGKLAGFIAETYPSVGGQIIPPDGYFANVYRKIRQAGGVCIADEVQTGLGRLGDYYFAFEQQQVVPDIVVLGKPIGNGHPMGVVITTRAISNSFAQGPEFFSTFGGSTLSCVVGTTVLNIVDDEGLQENARSTGTKLLDGLKGLQQRHRAIGDVRGMGLFIGVELIEDSATLSPATDLASYLVNRLREQRILIGVEGPDNNILKIRPPLTIQQDDVEMILFWIDVILNESAVLNSYRAASPG